MNITKETEVEKIMYTITPNLRYAEKLINFSRDIKISKLRLQQLWKGSDGSEEWRWVEEVK